MDNIDRDIIAATQSGLPLTLEPYETLAKQMGISANEIMQRLTSMQELGIIRRIGAIPNHYKLGYKHNGMTVWDIDDDYIDEPYGHCMTWTYPSGTQSPGTKVVECKTYADGAFEQARNLSQLPNSKESVIEPRIVGAPGTIKVDGVWTDIDEDKQNPNVFYVSYGTATNPPVLHGDTDEVQEFPAPLDLYYSFSQDQGQNFVEVAWDVNPDSEGNFAGETVYRWDYLAKGDGEQGEAQLRMTPDGSRFYATWLYDSEEASDITFRRIMSPAFLVNTIPVTPTE